MCIRDRGYGLSLAVWSMAAVLHGFATGTAGFAIARALLGVGESGNFPAANKTVAEWFPPVSYTHLDVYKRQATYTSLCIDGSSFLSVALSVMWRHTLISAPPEKIGVSPGIAV